MPWFPDFVAAVELARRETRAAGQVDPVGQYLTAIEDGDAHALETVWPGEVEVLDPLGRRDAAVTGNCGSSSGRVRPCWPSAMPPSRPSPRRRAEGAPSSSTSPHLDRDGRRISWPVAVVAESPDERSVVFRTYCSQWPVVGRRPVRAADPRRRDSSVPGDVVGRYQAALDAGDTDGIVSTFAADGYVREPIGSVHRGPDELRSFFAECFSAGRHRPRALQHHRRRRRAAPWSTTASAGAADELAPQAGLVGVRA